MSILEFKLDGPLPTGVTNISASAGTGKTYALASLAVRYVAEAEISVAEILVVTFTRAAARELKDRIRQRLVQAEGALRPGAGPPDPEDHLLVHLAAEDRPNRHRRLLNAVAEFDAATITTIHGFAQQALGTLGVAAPADPDATLVEDSQELIRSVCADLLAEHALSEATDIKLSGLEAMVAKVLTLPDVHIIPDDDSGSPKADLWGELVRRGVHRVTEARRASATLAYDDILTQLRDALSSDPHLVESLRTRFGVALIDEFQDTDSVQWGIFAELFQGAPLVLVGDPKQAIYAFRGADIHTYLRATSRDEVQQSALDANWRSDGALITALNALLANSTFGDAEIRYVPLQPSAMNRDLRMVDAKGEPLPPLVFRNLAEDAKGKPAAAGDLAAAIASDLAERVRALLEGTMLPVGDDLRPARPGDVAVLVRSHSETAGIQQALDLHGIPSVVSKVGSVFRTPAAAQMRRLLAAMARPSSVPRVRAAALGWFGSADAAALDSMDSNIEISLAEQLNSWAEVLSNSGVHEFGARAWKESDVAQRVLRMPDGDRHLTDLEHILEVLGTAEANSDFRSVNGLLERFDLLASGEDELASELLERRIDSDAAAVQITTIHGAKGLEWPIVCCPSLSRQMPALKAPNIVFHDDEIGGRVIDVGTATNWAGDRERRAKARAEAEAEATRLAYVALTRAKHHLIVWRHGLAKKHVTPLAQILFGPGAKAQLADDFDTEIAPLISEVTDLVEVSRVRLKRPKPPATRWTPTDAQLPPSLEVARLGRDLPRKSRRWSFTAISSHAARHQGGLVALDPTDISGGDSGGDDEYQGDDAPVEVFIPPVTDLCWGEVPGSAAFGTMVHSAFEEIDFAARGLRSEIGRVVDELGKWNEWPADVSVIKEGIHQAMTTPLGPTFGGLALAEIRRQDRLDELVFDFGCGINTPATDREIGELILEHLEPGHGLEPWAQEVAAGAFGVELQGHLTGSVDAVIRLHDPQRFVVVDYKTNSVSEPGMPLMSSDYHPDNLVMAMANHHYPLQALLYGVALHRYLRWRLRNYDPTLHLGGVAYLFVRGMTGADTPTDGGRPHGVFSWNPTPGLITALSDLLNGAHSEGVGS